MNEVLREGLVQEEISSVNTHLTSLCSHVDGSVMSPDLARIGHPLVLLSPYPKKPGPDRIMHKLVT